MHDDTAPPDKKRRKTNAAAAGKPYVPENYPDDEDDEEPQTPRVKIEAMTQKEGNATHVARKGQHNKSRRLVVLSFGTPHKSDVYWPLPENIVAQIPIYASKLAQLKTVGGEHARFCIADDEQRDEHRMLDIFDYLTTGYIRPVASGSERARVDSLKRLIALCELAHTLEIAKLMTAVVHLISEELVWGAECFTSVADQCCSPGCTLDVSPGSPLGKWLGENLALNLVQLRAAGHIGRIAQQGGKLARILGVVLAQKET